MTNKFIKTLNLITLLLVAPAAWPETINCTPITTLPYVITVQGNYCFTGDLATAMTTGNAIEIQTNNVTIDMNGWKLGGLAAGAGTQSHGIYAYRRKNITIRNGTIRGFMVGVRLDDVSPYTTSQGHLIEDIRTDKNTYVGLSVQGRGSIVRRNQVVDTGGSTLVIDAYGIILYGPGSRILNNDVNATVVTGSNKAYGLYIRNAVGAVVEGNRISDTKADISTAYGIFITSNDVVVEDNRIAGNGSTAFVFGIYIVVSNNVLVASNRIISADYGIYFISGSTGKYMDNLTSNVTTPFTSGTAVGTNS